jgi:hypothetical protein
MSDPNFLEESVTLVKMYYHVGISESDGLWTLAFSVKGEEAEFLVSCNLIGGNRQPLDLRPWCEAALSVTCIIVSLTLFFRSMISYIDDQQFQLSVTSWHLTFKCAYWHHAITMFNSVMVHNVTQWSTSWLKHTQLTLDIGMLHNIFLSHTKM